MIRFVHITMPFSRSRLTHFPLALLLALIAIPSARAQQQSDLDALASEVAGAILKSSEGMPVQTKVIVIDFAETHGSPTALGAELANEFSASLEKQAKRFVVIDHGDFARAVAKDMLSSEIFANQDAMECYGPGLGAAAVVEGSLDDFSDRVVLWVGVHRNHRRIFNRRVTLPLTAEMRTLLAKPAPGLSAREWVSPNHPPQEGGDHIPKPGQKVTHTLIASIVRLHSIQTRLPWQRSRGQFFSTF